MQLQTLNSNFHNYLKFRAATQMLQKDLLYFSGAWKAVQTSEGHHSWACN